MTKIDFNNIHAEKRTELDMELCPECSGSGVRVKHGDSGKAEIKECFVCEGSGRVLMETTIEISPCSSEFFTIAENDSDNEFNPNVTVQYTLCDKCKGYGRRTRYDSVHGRTYSESSRCGVCDGEGRVRTVRTKGKIIPFKSEKIERGKVITQEE